MNRLSPIPMSARARWDIFCSRYLPILAFMSALVGVVFAWRQVGSEGIGGIAEASQTLVSAPHSGQLVQVLVPPYESVTAGQPLAILQPTDPRAAFDVLQAELALAQLKGQPSIAEGNAMNFERIRVELLRTKSELAVARVNLARSEQEAELSSRLHRERLISEDLFDLAQKSRDAYRAEVESKSLAVASIEERLEELSTLGVPQQAATNAGATLLGHLEELKRVAERQFAPITLVAPKAGLLHAVYRQSGENVVEGESLFSISPLRSERIVGYFRQPYPVDIQVGMRVEVATREQPRRIFESELTQIGARVEVITNALAIRPATTLLDVGLPFVVNLPEHVSLRPGQAVDLRLRESESYFGGNGASVNRVEGGNSTVRPLIGRTR